MLKDSCSQKFFQDSYGQNFEGLENIRVFKVFEEREIFLQILGKIFFYENKGEFF